ncbi:DUF3261 domain-containing protein [Hylemonella gracilis]|jgi:hypothetical protein|uniref:DUF3261 domain-containing protein n=1 Tax=Hylemonella gracilis TaxID=80880 RepID=A0A4P6UMB4_9BURK|nr:DUF3261 domain-containing protein [Hylemonella gracilis]QBK05255.1 DUF3261 domain-containing protein [Hylemonella gracilis]
MGIAHSFPRLLVAWLAAGLLTGCALLRPAPDEGSGLSTDRPAQTVDGTAPLLRLPPASLGRSLALEQRIRIEARDENGAPLRRQIETLLEADPHALRIVLLYMGQTAAVLEWDGRRLKETRSSWWPATLRGERILSELQLALWPAEAVRTALAEFPDGVWTLDADETGRTLRQDGEAVVQIRYQDGIGLVELQHLRDGYRLTIRSHSLEP